MYRSIICFIVIASLILCSTSIAFANPLNPWTSVQADRVTNGVISINNTLSNVYTGLTALYNYLKNNGDGVVEGLLVLANRVSNIISTLDYYLPLQNSVLQNLYSFFAPPSGDTRDIWDLLSQISANTTATSTALNTTNSELLTIDSHIDGVEGSLTSIGSRLDTANVNLQSLESINWNHYNNNFTVQYSNDGINYFDSINDINESTNIYFKIFGTKIDNSLFKIYFPLYTYSDYSNYIDNKIYLDIYNKGHFEFFDYNYLYQNLRSTIAFVNPFYLFYNNSSYPCIFHFHSDALIKIDLASNISFDYINYDSNDYYTIASYLELTKLNNQSSNLSDIKNILIDIDNNSDFIQNNNDLEINVDIDTSDGQGITAIISKLQDLFDFGVGLQEFLVTLNEFDNLHWFTRVKTYEQVNYDPRTNLGYQDLYD